MKVQSLQQLVDGMEPALFELFDAADRRRPIVEFAHSSLRRTDAYPRPFVFFTGRPKHCKSADAVLVIINDKLHMSLVTRGQQLRLKGRVCYFLKKSAVALHFGLSTQVFVKFRLPRPCVRLHKIIDALLRDQRQDPFPLLFDCLTEFPTAPESRVFRDYFLGLVITPNFELGLRLQLATVADADFKRRFAEALLIITARSHVAMHLVRGLLGPYFASLVNPRDFFAHESVANFFLAAMPRVFARKELKQAAEDIKVTLRDQSNPAVYLKHVTRRLRGVTLPPILVKLAKYVCEALVRRYGDADVESPLIVISGFLFYHGLRDFFDGAPHAKVNCVNKLLMMDPTDPHVRDALPAWKRVVAKLVDARVDNRRFSGLSGGLGTAAFDSLVAILRRNAESLKACCAQVAPEDIVPAMTTVLQAIFTEFDIRRAGTPDVPLHIRLDPERLDEWRRDHGHPE
jgi:hypothetical protein